MLISFIVLFVIIGSIGFYSGFLDGKRKSMEAWENQIRYITMNDLEDMVSDMRENGADDDEIVVLIKPDWLESD